MDIIQKRVRCRNLLQLLSWVGYNETMIVTSIQENKKNKKRMSVFLDDEYSFSCYKETLLEEGICEGCVLGGSDVDRIRVTDGRQYAWNCAIQYLSRSLRSEKQVADKLRERGVDPRLIAETMQRLHECRLVDDAEFARLYAQNAYERYGRREVVRRLREKGIAQEVIDEVTAQPVDTGVLDKYVMRLMKRYSKEDPRNRAGKVMRSLAARGFEFDDIRLAVLRFEKQQNVPADE